MAETKPHRVMRLEDSDGDGVSNLQEYLAGTDPTNGASAFRILSVMPTNNDLLVSWVAGGGRTTGASPMSGNSLTPVIPSLRRARFFARGANAESIC